MSALVSSLPSLYLDLARIFRRLRLSLRMRFLRHLARIFEGEEVDGQEGRLKEEGVNWLWVI